MQSTFNKIEDALTPIKNAVRDLQVKNEVTQEQLGTVLADRKSIRAPVVKRQSLHHSSSKPPIKRSKTGSLPYLL